MKFIIIRTKAIYIYDIPFWVYAVYAQDFEKYSENEFRIARMGYIVE